ncbi:hypothetical protein HRbin36_01890 [bacterium HR36]|nr:hypothetical protein HRbin36_01890 [bacterium HR36]
MGRIQARKPRAVIISLAMAALCCAATTQWQIHLHWPVGQELLYRGEVHETASGRGVQFRREYALEVRALALEQRGDDVEVAFLTLLRPKTAGLAQPENGTVRLEVAWVTALGEIIAPNRMPPTVSLEAPTTWECGFVARFPRTPAWKEGQTWQHTEPGQPVEEWRVVRRENLAGTTCVKLLRVQKSEDWEKPRADRRAWYRRDVIWLEPRLGIAQRVEREIARREPAHVQATGSIITRYELVSSLRYEPRLLEDCKRDIRLTAQLQDQLRDLLTPGRAAKPEDFLALVRHAEQAQVGPATPYRLALQRLARTAEAASRREVTPVAAQDVPAGLEIGKAAPEFLVPDWRTGQNVSLRQFRGRPTLLLFLQPRSDLSREVLLQVQRLVQNNPEWDMRPVVLFMEEDREAVRDLLQRRDWPYPVLLGRALRASYQVEATPRLVLLDGQGVVQGQYTGWGPEIPLLLRRDLRRIAEKK